jgi:hypothetical protein
VEYYVHVWRRVLVVNGLPERRDEILAAVREAIGTASAAAESGRGDRKGRTARWLRHHRKWSIALASLLVVLAVGLGLGLGLTRDHASSAEVVMSGQVRWSLLRPGGSLPAPRATHELVQDPTSGRIIMFGGQDGGEGFNDTWAYNPTGITWTELRPSGTVPSPRWACTMTYDPVTRRMILFGGRNASRRLNDTWAYDPAANTWTELKPSGNLPLARGGHVMVRDPSSGRMIMFGGRSGETDFLNDTWTYDPVANTWSELKPTGNLPVGRGQPAMAYDQAARKAIMFGGWNLDGEFSDTWMYDPIGNAWTELEPKEAAPPARAAHDLAYDSSRNVAVVFGGISGTAYLNDTWAFDSARNTWSKFSVLHGAAPTQRANISMVYDPSGARVILFGGEDGGSSLNDTFAGSFQVP